MLHVLDSKILLETKSLKVVKKYDDVLHAIFAKFGGGKPFVIIPFLIILLIWVIFVMVATDTNIFNYLYIQTWVLGAL
jgi:uncharacterized integral membrane protein